MELKIFFVIPVIDGVYDVTNIYNNINIIYNN
jgi:hypothetical protein